MGTLGRIASGTSDDLIARDGHAGGLERLEALHRDRDLVGAELDELDVVVPLPVRGRLVGILRAGVDGDDLSARHHRAAAVGHRADQRRLRRQLRGGRRRARQT